MGALPNATYIGFTGTPIDRTAYGKGTFKIFGGDDPKGYLDKYSIRESVADGTTVPLHYALAPNDLRVDRETLEQEFLDAGRAGGRQRRRGTEPGSRAGGDAQEHAEEPGPGRAGRRVRRPSTSAPTSSRWATRRSWSAVDREACCLYKGPSTSTCRRSSRRSSSAGGTERPGRAAQASTSPRTRRSAVRKAFRKPGRAAEDPDRHREAADRLRRPDPLLHVPGQADAGPRAAPGHRPRQPPLRGRRGPAQALRVRARLRRHLREAGEGAGLRLRGRGGGRRGARRAQRAVRASSWREGRTKYLPIPQGKSGDKAVEAVLEHFRDKESAQEFYAFFRELEELYEILSPDAFLRPLHRRLQPTDGDVPAAPGQLRARA